MKSNTIKYFFLTGLVIFFVACSTKKNTLLARASHSLSTEYNILYNGGIALDKGILELKSQYRDNFWEILPIERMQVSEESMLPGTKKNANFELAETKAAKAIQKHSMNIDGAEKNPQMDEAHLLLGQARYYDQRFVPALEAFNYVLYKHQTSDKINLVKIWREKTNMRLDNDALAVTNLQKLLKDIKFKDQVFADANATLAQAFLNLKENDSAISKLKLATDYTKSNEEKARYRFILAQIYEKQGYKDSAFAKYQEIIKMKRKSPRQYVIHAQANQANQFDFEKGDTISFNKKFKKLLADRENKPFLDVLNHQMGLYYDKKGKLDIAKKYYNTSLKNKTQDNYLVASNYRNLADIYFNKAEYSKAGNYYDSTLAVLEPRSREHKLITKKRLNLDDVIKYEAIAKRNDSILKIASMSNSEKEDFYQKYIDKIKKEEEKIKALVEKTKAANLNQDIDNAIKPLTKDIAAPTKQGDFYFYNPSTVAYGRTQFAKNWGKRNYGPNWRLISAQKGANSNNDDNNDDNDIAEDVSDKENEHHSTSFYIKQLPNSQVALDSIAKERNFAYYQLGSIYKDKFKEYKLAANKLETLLTYNPEERLILPSMYNLFKIYEIIDASKATLMKGKIVAQYPDSRYAQILNNSSVDVGLGTPEVAYKNLYKDYDSGLFRETLVKTDIAIVQFTGEETLPKFELLKANLIGKLHGLAEYKKALNFVALTYPNTEEGKQTENFITTKIPLLESLYFNGEIPVSWKLVFAPANSLDEKALKPLMDKLTKFTKERTIEKLSVSNDVYTLDKNLIVIHGIKSEESAKGIAQVLKEFKDYKISEPSIVISNENYKIVQIYKNLDEYILGKGPNFDAKQKAAIVFPKADEPKKNIQIPSVQIPKDNPNANPTSINPIQNKKDMERDDPPARSNMMPPSSTFEPNDNPKK